MGRDRRAFALLTALVTVSAVFAAALALAALSRSAVIESGALSRSLDAELRARTAASRVIAGVVGESVTPSGDAAPDGSGGSDGPEIDTDELPEMPEFLRDFLDEYLEEPAQEEDEEEGDAAGGSSGGRTQSTDRSARFLSARGLPAAPVRVSVDGVPLRVELSDALGLINLNSADAETLAVLFENAGASAYDAESIASQIIDYRDKDDFVSPRGAEAADYLRRGLSIRNEPFAAVEELLYLPSITPELYRRVKDLVCLQGDGKIHVLSAPREVLAVVPGVGEAGARSLVELREAGALDAETLKESLSLFETGADSRFRFSTSPLLRVRIVPEGPGPVFTALAAVTDEGIRWGPFEQE